MEFLVTSGSLNKMVKNPYRDHLTQEWCQNSFPLFIDKDRWPPSSPGLNPLDDSIRDKLINVIDWNKIRSETGHTD